MAYSLSKGYTPEDYIVYDALIKYGFTHEAFIPGLTTFRISQGQSRHQMIGSIGLPLATAYAVTAWATGQTYVSMGSAIFTAVTGSSPGVVVAPVLGVTAAVVLGNELQTTLHSNVGMEPIPGSGGGYSNPMGGSGDDFHYPGKGIIEYLFGE